MTLVEDVSGGPCGWCQETKSDDHVCKGGAVIPPSGCRHCGVEARDHCQRWASSVGWHRWVEPTQEQIKARMLARRNPVTFPRPTEEETTDEHA